MDIQTPPQNPIVPQEPKWYHNEKILWTIIGVLLLVVIVGSVYWWKEIKNTPKVTVENESATADWKKYTNTEYGFEFKYPEDWKLAQLDRSNGGTINLSASSNDDIVLIYSTDGESEAAHTEEGEEVINNTPFAFRAVDDGTSKKYFYETLGEGIAFEFSTSEGAAGGLPILRQILSTFEFIDASYWEEYNRGTKATQTTVYSNSALNFSLTFPAGWYLPKTDDPDPHFFNCPIYDCDGINIRRQDDGVFGEGLANEVTLNDFIPGAKVVRGSVSPRGESWPFVYQVMFSDDKRFYLVQVSITDKAIESILKTMKAN